MMYHIRGEHMDMTDALKDYVEKKLSKLERYLDTPLETQVHVTLSVLREQHVVEVTIPLPGMMLRAEVRNPDMYASVDLVVDKLERQIRKHKTKVNRKLKQAGGLKDLIIDKEGSSARIYEDEDDLEVVRTKRFTLKPMDVEEAVLQMNLIGHSFFVFNNMDTEEINVVYRRDDGKYGLIEPAK